MESLNDEFLPDVHRAVREKAPYVHSLPYIQGQSRGDLLVKNRRDSSIGQ